MGAYGGATITIGGGGIQTDSDASLNSLEIADHLEVTIASNKFFRVNLGPSQYQMLWCSPDYNDLDTGHAMFLLADAAAPGDTAYVLDVYDLDSPGTRSFQIRLGGDASKSITLTNDGVICSGGNTSDDQSVAFFHSKGHYNATNSTGYKVNGTKVVGVQQAAVADASGGVVVDIEARAAINALLDRIRAHGAIAT